MLLAAYAAIEAFPSYDLPDAILEDLRTRTLKYVETLERYAATSDSASVEKHLSENDELQASRRQCFEPLFALLGPKVDRAPTSHTATSGPVVTSTAVTSKARKRTRATAADLAADDAEKTSARMCTTRNW